MKKLATLLMLAAIILVGGMSMEAKTTKKKTSKTSTTKKTSKPSGALALVNLSNGGKLYLMNNGKVKVTPASWDSDGKYVESNGAYIMNWGTGSYGDNKISVIFGNTMYTVINSDYEDGDFWNYYWDNNFNLSKSVSFDASSKAVILKTNGGSYRVNLSNVSSDYRKNVTWY